MKALLDFSREFDITLMDNVVMALYSGSGGKDQQVAQQVLTQFQEHPDAWTRVPDIMERSSYSQTKFIGLQILERLVNTRWKTLPEAQRQGVRNFVVGITVKIAEKTYINKLNLALVQILKQEWPHNWPTFIPELVESCKTNLALCENNMVILRLLSEEVFDYSAEQLTQTKIKNLKNQMCGEFSEIFKLCAEILEEASKTSLVRATLETLLRFLNWIPLGYIFETTIVDVLIQRFLEAPDFRNLTLKCLAEVAALSVGPEYDPKFVSLFEMVMTAINRMVPPNTNIAQASSFLVSRYSLAISFRIHLKTVENERTQDVLLNAHLYMVKISQLYDEIQSLPIGDSGLLMGLSLGGTNGAHNMLNGKMVKPEEVLIVENEEGEIVREFMKESDTIVLYKSMRELLDVADTENILTEKLAKQVDGSEWSWQNLNTLCWAIGSISGAMNEETEKRFLVTIKRGKDNKAVVASDIMYIVGQYPRFLKAHWKFLKTVVNKLFEFMHETHEGVQDMACDTFIKIAQKCRRHFVMQQSQEQDPFVDEILRLLHRITVDLSPQQVHTFYEAVGYMISAQPNKPQQEKLIAKLMELPNAALMAQAAANKDVLSNPDNLRILSNVLKTNVAACTSIGSFFLPQIGLIYMDMLGLYRAVSGIISETGQIATKTPKIRQLRTVKKEILKLVETYIRKAEDLEAARDAEVLNVMSTITSRLGNLLTPQVPPILEAVFEPTLNMINQDFAEFPEHRVGFFKLLRAINLNCFPALLGLLPQQFKLFIDSSYIAETGLNLCLEIINNFAAADTQIANQFFQQYYLSVLQDTFFVLTDADHKSGFKLQSLLLARMVQLVATDAIQAPLFDPAVVNDPNMTNAKFVRDYTANLLKSAFPHASSSDIMVFVLNLAEYHSDVNRFKMALRDFLIQLKEFSDDNGELFVDEKEAEAARKAQLEREAALKIPGMLKPSQLEDKDEDI
ncbi:armadillo-type protein [Lactarius indigo]|nr:armadillo-type protein [Lactarius indigo]